MYFANGKATIRKVSWAMLDEVASALAGLPSISIRIEGHTDSPGSDRANLRLSQKRAESVRKFLIKKGVPAARLVAKGYGETIPVADNATKAGRDKNRRVEFFILPKPR